MLALALALGGSASAGAIGFDSSEGYSVGRLFGQPSTTPQWEGDDTSKIRVTDAQSHEASGQSVLLDADFATGRVDNRIDIDRVTNEFSVRFYWRPSGTNGANAAVYLSEFAGVTNAGVGPWVQFVGAGAVYQIKYLEGGFVRNIKLGMDPLLYEDQWTEVEIVGDMRTRTFDFYLAGVEEATGLPFRTVAAGSRANRLEYLNLQASTGGASDHYFDSFDIDVAPPIVPTLSFWGWAVLVVLMALSVSWLASRQRPESA